MINSNDCCHFSEIADVFRKYRRFAVIAHFRPDGDAIGSTLALGNALKEMGKEVIMINEDPVPHQLRFMSGSDQIQVTPEHLEDIDVAISLDNGTLKRLGARSVEALSQVKVLVNIDHHETNDRFGDYVCVRPMECATCAVLYHLFRYMELPLTPIMRDALYVGISTDTGSFQYSKTTPEVMEMAADLIRQGVNVHEINRQLYQETTWAKLQLMREELNGMKLSFNQRIASYCLTNQVKQSLGVTPDDTEGLIDVLRSVEGVWLAAYFEEIEDDARIRVSLRSKVEAISVSKIAEQFNGGGHSMAAGIRMPGPIENASALILEALEAAAAHYQSTL